MIGKTTTNERVRKDAFNKWWALPIFRQDNETGHQLCIELSSKTQDLFPFAILHVHCVSMIQGFKNRKKKARNRFSIFPDLEKKPRGTVNWELDGITPFNHLQIISSFLQHKYIEMTETHSDGQ